MCRIAPNQWKALWGESKTNGIFFQFFFARGAAAELILRCGCTSVFFFFVPALRPISLAYVVIGLRVHPLTEALL